jgi:hypothetical protein
MHEHLMSLPIFSSEGDRKFLQGVLYISGIIAHEALTTLKAIILGLQKFLRQKVKVKLSL